MPIFIFPIVSQWQPEFLPDWDKNNNNIITPAYRCYILNIVRIGFMASVEMSFENVDDGRRRTDDGCLALL